MKTGKKIGRPKVDEPASVQVSVRLTEKEYHRLREYASLHDLTMAQLLRMAVFEKMETDHK